MEYCLHNSNWWTLQRLKTADKETFSYYDFIAALRVQIERQLTKTSGNEFVLNGGYTVDGIQMLLEEHQFPQKLQPHSQGKEGLERAGGGGEYYPLLTFHATKNVGAVRSIAKHGYFMPGELHPTEGFTFKMQHGQYHGEGVYTSTRFDTAQWFSFFDRDNVVQLLVNFVLLGKTHYVNDDPPEQLSKVRDGYHTAAGGKGQMWSKTTSTPNPEYDRGILYTVHGEYGNGANTRLLPDLSVVVSGSGERVIPLAIVTLKPNWNCAWIKPYLRDKTTLLSLERQFTLDSEPATLYRICDDWHVIEPPKTQKKVEKKKKKELQQQQQREGNRGSTVLQTRHHFILPLSLLKRDVFSKNQLRDFFGATHASTKRLLLHNDNDVYVYTDCTGADQFESAVRTASPSSSSCSSSSSSTNSALLKALGSAFETITDEETRVVETVYLVVDTAQQPFVIDSTATEFVSKYERLVATARQTIVKVIRFGTSDADFSLVNKFKYRLQTVEHYESCLQHNVPLPTDWPVAIDTLLEESAALDHVHEDTFDYTVPMPYGVVGEGFVVDLVYNPLWGERHFERNALYKGYAPLPALGIGEKYHPVRYITRAQVVKTLLDGKEDIGFAHSEKRTAEELNERKREHEQAGQHYGRMIKLFCDGVVRLLCRFKTFVVRSQGRVQAYHGAVSLLCQSVLGELQTVQDEPELIAFCDLQHLRRTCCQIQTLLSDMNVFATVCFSGKWFDALMQMRFAKKILRRVGSSADESGNKSNGGGGAVLFEPPKEWTSLIGYRAQLRTTAASQVEPWLIIVDSLSNDQASALSSYTSHQCPREEEKTNGGGKGGGGGEKPFHVVPLEQSLKFAQLQYYAFAFTGNPYLFLVSQPRALPAVAWVRSLELLFRRNDARDDDVHVVAASKKQDYSADWDRCWTLFDYVQQQCNRRCDMLTLLQSIDAEKDITRLAKYLTEAAGVMSMCQLLSAMTVYTGSAGEANQREEEHKEQKETEEKFNRLAFAMMAECVMRNCRAYLRERGLAVNQVVRKTLGIDEQTPADFLGDVKESVARTGQFFRRRFTNCSPFALVAALGFLKRVHRGESKEQIWRAFESNEISMGRFLHDHFPRSAHYDVVIGQEVQLALFLQGVRFHKARLRTDLRFDNPRTIIRQSIEEQLALLANEKRARSMAQDRRTLRLQRRLDEAAPFNAYHQRLKLFTIDEVDEFNRKQSSTADWAILMPESGLLLHHCCYVDCPQFMHNFATKEDRECKRTTHKRRHGILQHFRHNHASGNYVSSFHLMARAYAKQTDYEQFVRKMDKHFASSAAYNALKNKEQYLRDAYEFHQRR